MRVLRWISVLAVVLVAVAFATNKWKHTFPPSPEYAPRYISAYPWQSWTLETVKKSRKEKKLILLSFDTLCNRCNESIDKALSAPKLKAYFNKNFIPVKIHARLTPDLADELATNGNLVILSAQNDAFACDKPNAANISAGNLSALLKNSAEKLSRETSGATCPSETLNSIKIFTCPQTSGLRFSLRKEIQRALRDKSAGDRAEAYRNIRLFFQISDDEKYKSDGSVETSLKTESALEDTVAGGFFECAPGGAPECAKKTLSTNADAAVMFFEAYRALGNDNYRYAAIRTLEFIENSLRNPRGGYFDALYADVVAKKGIVDGAEYYKLDARARARTGLPAVDATVFVDSNAKLASAFFAAYSATGDEKYLNRGESLLRFLKEKGLDPAAGMVHALNSDADPGGLAFDDQTAMTRALLDGYEATGRREWLSAAELVQRRQTRIFWASRWNYHLPEDKSTPSFVQSRTASLLLSDDAQALDNLIRLAILTGKKPFKEEAEKTDAFALNIAGCNDIPPAASFLTAKHRKENAPLEIVVLGDSKDERWKALHKAALEMYLPWKVVLPLDAKADRDRLATLPYRPRPAPVIFACASKACAMPISDPRQVGPRLKQFIERFKQMDE